jgi:transposase
MLERQIELPLSKYNELYDILIPEDDMFRQIKELVDFTFVIDALTPNYSLDFGRKAEDPIRMFKYLMLKDMNELSDKDLVKRTRTDMSFKYFLDLSPEEVDLIHPTSLTKFRRLRLKDENLMNTLISKTIEIALENNIELGNALIVDATHTHARYQNKTAEEVLIERAKKLRKEVYKHDEAMKEKFPPKLISPTLEEIMEYCDEIAKVVESEGNLVIKESIAKKLNYLREGIEDTDAALDKVSDTDARYGYKTKDDPFLGYKTHVGMTENRLIVAATITSGEKSDGKELKSLIEKSTENKLDLKEVIGDTAYSGKENLEYAKAKNIKIIAKLNPIISQSVNSPSEKGFEYNKDAGLFACPAGYLAFRKAVTGKKKSRANQSMTYYFDIEKCKECSQREGCYKDGAKTKTLSITIKTEEQQDQLEFENTVYFKKRYRERYMIEAKNSELKNQHGYSRAISAGLFGMRIQGAISIFNVNIKRILKLKK